MCSLIESVCACDSRVSVYCHAWLIYFPTCHREREKEMEGGREGGRERKMEGGREREDKERGLSWLAVEHDESR